MANINPIAAQSNRPSSSKDYDKQEEDEFEDSLNISTSEHISEEIENDDSNITSAEDSIEKSKRDFVQNKRRQLFDLGDDGEADLTFSKFDIDNDALRLSGDNIAQHFKVDDRAASVSEPSEKQSTEIDASRRSLSPKITEEKSSEVEADKSAGDTQSAIQSNIGDQNEISGRDSKAVAAAALSGGEENDVILINDHQISIGSLKKLQTQQPSSSASDPNVSTNQNTTSDISDLLNEHSASLKKEEMHVKNVSQGDDEEKSESAATNLAEAKHSLSIRLEGETMEEKQQEMTEIVIDVVNKLPIDKTLQAPVAAVANSATTTDSEQPASSAVTEINYENNSNKLFESELDVNLIHMQNKIRELKNIAAGKYDLATVVNLPADIQGGSSSRRDSLRDFPHSGRESTSITTNSTEYKTFPDEYFQLTDLQMALHERDQVIQDLNSSLQQSLKIRDLLIDQSERLSTEVKQLRAVASSSRAQWKSMGEATGGINQRLSETTIDLVSESEFDDDEYYNKLAMPPVAQEAEIVIKPTDQTPDVSLPQTAIEEFKKNLTTEELKVFISIQNKFSKYLHQEVEAFGKSYAIDVQEQNEKDVEINRLRQLLVNMKTGSVEVKELRHELDIIHKKEMEDLRMYFERKCTDLEKQYSEEVFSQHSRRHSNDTNSDLSDGEIFSPDERRKSKAGEILASPTHRKITPTNISGTSSLSSPKRASRRSSQHDSNAPSNGHKESAVEHLHEFYRKQINDLKRSNDETIKHLNYKLQSRQSDDEYTLTKSAARSDELTNAKLLKNNINNENNELFNDLVHEYDRRLEEQVKLAKADMLNELESQIKTLLSETAPEESRWPPELILLREKFTAKSQLEIAQLQIKHEEEMSRLKSDCEKQMNRKLKRHLNFDDGRDLEKCVLERDNLRELCNVFRHLLYELAKCVSVCDYDLNATLADELNKYGILQKSNSRPASPSAATTNDTNESNLSTCPAMRVAFVPDVSGILSVIDDPSLVNFVTESIENEDDTTAIDLDGTTFNLNECLEKLKSEADTLLHLSENLVQKRVQDNREIDRNDSIEEDDGLKSRKLANNNAASKDDINVDNGNQKQRLSLPIYLPGDRKVGTNSELNEVKNRLVLAERKRQELETELTASVTEQSRLNEELRLVTIKLNNYIDGRSEELSEGYGISQLRSPQRQPTNKSSTSFTALQERAKQYFNDTTSTENVSQLLQLIEDFCREGDKLIEEEKQVKKDLQEQIEAADKQRKQDLRFLDEQAAEREVERDEFLKEIEKLKSKLRDKEKDRAAYETYVEESEQMEQQIHDLASTIETNKVNNARLQTELKSAIDKIYDLREIITELEVQVNTKNMKLRALEIDMNDTTTANESLHHEVESLKTQTETAPVYEETIKELEEQIRSLQPSAEQSAVIESIAGHLREIEDNLDRKTNLLESIHVMTGSATSCSSPSEDVSIRGSANNLDGVVISPRNFKYLAKDPAFPIDQILRITEKLQKHTKVEEAAIKRVRDLEMQIKALHNTYVELQSERDLLQEKMSEQIMRISSIQSRLDEQRQRAEELQRAGTSDLNLKVYDLQTELSTLKETLSARDKQINVLKTHLGQSKEIIDKQETEIALVTSANATTTDQNRLDKLVAEIEAKNVENKNLRDKMRTEMITKVALPDLMETMLADKTDEIDYLREQLEARENELKAFRERQLLGAIEEKFSFIFAKDSSVNNYDENDHTRRLPEAAQDGVSSTFAVEPRNFFSNNDTPKEPEIIGENSPSLNILRENMAFPDLTPSPNPRKIVFTSKSTVESNVTTPNQTASELDALQLKIDEITKERNELRQAVKTHELKLNALDAEKRQLSDDIQSKRDLIHALETKIATKEKAVTALNVNYDRKCDDYDVLNVKMTEQLANIEVMKQQLESLNNTVQLKDELLSKYKAAKPNGQSEMIQRQLQDENDQLKEILADTERELSEKMIAYEKCLLDIDEHKKTIYHLNDVLTDSKTARSVEEMRVEIRNYCETNEQLKDEIEQLRNRLYHNDRSTSPTPKPFSIDEISDRVEKELNYSAQLDSSILKAIENDDIKSDHNREGAATISSLRSMCQDLEQAKVKLEETLEAERKKFESIREQDAGCIETMTQRLETALEQESELNHLLDDERAKTAQLSTKILEHQFERSKVLCSSELMLNSPLTSPRRQKSIDFDHDVVKRLTDEIKLLKSQVERQKERSEDTEKSLLREKNRFEVELSEQKSYGEGMRHEIDRVLAENQELQNELDVAHDRLTASAHDIENLQLRIQNLQEADGYRIARSEKERNELAQNAAALQDLQTKLNGVERERDLLHDRVSILQNQNSGLMLPQQQLLSKLKEMNEHLSENVRENRQLSETLQFLTDERQMLQKRVFDLQQTCCDRDELEEKANHLFGKYLRTESFRRALVHQKRYLMIVLSTYEANEAKVMSLVNSHQTAMPKRRKITSFKSLVLVAIAIERMKYILRRWHTGKRVCAKAILPHNTPPRRTHSASTINWNRSGDTPLMPNILYQPQSPPSRDRPSILKGRRNNIENNAPM